MTPSAEPSARPNDRAGPAADGPRASATKLFEPVQVAGLQLRNRTVMAPMTRRFAPGGIPGENVVEYYRRRAAADVGLIITEGVWIPDPSASNEPHVPRLYGSDALAGWTRVVQAVHAEGGRIMPQLWHVGIVADTAAGSARPPRIASPSGIYPPDRLIVEPMSSADIEVAIDAYATAAANAKAAGFDGVELHAAHGYLIDQFFWETTNRRTDRYGGDLRARTRFAVEVVQECRRRTGPGFPLVLRFSQFKFSDYAVKPLADPARLGEFLAPLVDAGVDVFHCSQRRFWEPEFPGSDLNLAGWTRKLTGRPTITVGSIGLDTDAITCLYLDPDATAAPASLDRLYSMLWRGDFDLVALGRVLLCDPSWVRKVGSGRLDALQPYDPDALRSLR